MEQLSSKTKSCSYKFDRTGETLKGTQNQSFSFRNYSPDSCWTSGCIRRTAASQFLCMNLDCVWPFGCAEENKTLTNMRSLSVLSACWKIWIINEVALFCLNAESTWPSASENCETQDRVCFVTKIKICPCSNLTNWVINNLNPRQDSESGVRPALYILTISVQLHSITITKDLQKKTLAENRQKLHFFSNLLVKKNK